MAGDNPLLYNLQQENEYLRKRNSELEALHKKNSLMKCLIEESRNTFKNLVEHSPASIHVLQNDRFVYVNPAFTLLTGYSLQECSEISCWDMVHPDYLDLIKERHEAMQRGEEVVQITELKIITKSGQEIWVNHSATTTIWAGKPSIIAILHDLTARKIIEDKFLSQHKILEHIYAELQNSQKNLLDLNARLQESEERMELAFWATDEGLWDLNITNGDLFFSAREVTMLGYEVADIFPHLSTWQAHVHPDDLENVVNAFKSHYHAQTDHYEAEYRLQAKSGEWVWILDRGRIVKWDKNGKPLRMVGTKQDIRKKREADQKLKISEERYRQLFEQSPIGLLKIDLHGYILDANKYYVDINGAPSKKAVTSINLLEEARHREDLANIIGDLSEIYIKLQPFSMDMQYVSKWGKTLWMHYKADPVFDHEHNFLYYIVACEEISERKEAEARIKYLSFNDSLTGLYNRAFFEEEIKRLDAVQQLPLSIIMGDVNGLKLLNDTFGHLSADKLLITIAGILQSCCRSEDIIARWGGDEFVILLPQTSEMTAYGICEQIRSACRESIPVPIQPSIALGVASKNNLSQDIYKVISEAEDIMYRNKLLESKSTRNSIISSLEASLHEKTYETREHAHRMQKLCTQFGQAIGLPGHEMDRLTLLAKLHDIGKIGIPDDILNKPGALSSAEWDAIKKHPEIGYRIVYSSHELMAIAEEVLCHHERWDGTGYPRGLHGEEIPLLARILAIVDAYDVMTHVRSYKEAFSHEQALHEILICSTSQFDPKLAAKFIKIFSNKTVS